MQQERVLEGGSGVPTLLPNALDARPTNWLSRPADGDGRQRRAYAGMHQRRRLRRIALTPHCGTRLRIGGHHEGSAINARSASPQQGAESPNERASCHERSRRRPGLHSSGTRDRWRAYNFCIAPKPFRVAVQSPRGLRWSSHLRDETRDPNFGVQRSTTPRWRDDREGAGDGLGDLGGGPPPRADFRVGRIGGDNSMGRGVCQPGTTTSRRYSDMTHRAWSSRLGEATDRRFPLPLGQPLDAVTQEHLRNWSRAAGSGQGLGR
jgi:hypothetical protein